MSDDLDPIALREKFREGSVTRRLLDRCTQDEATIRGLLLSKQELRDRCTTAEASYQEAQLTIAGLEVERDHCRVENARLREYVAEIDDEAVEAVGTPSECNNGELQWHGRYTQLWRLIARMKKAEAEVERWQNRYAVLEAKWDDLHERHAAASVCELAADNPNVASYAAHWEGRAEKAEGIGRHETPEESNQRRSIDAKSFPTASSSETATQANRRRAGATPSCRVGADGREVSQVNEADIDAARDIIAEGRASHAGWAEHLKRCPGCEQCKTLGIDWGWEREQSWVERYDFLLSVLDSLAALRQQHAATVEAAFTEAVCCTATSTDQIAAGLAKWPESQAKARLT